MAARLRILVEGRVQGVGFRWFVRQEARRLGLAGWVRNLDDGRVEMAVAGEDGAVRRLLDHVRVGPDAAAVTSLGTEHLGEDVTLPYPFTVLKQTVSDDIATDGRIASLRNRIREIPDFPTPGIGFKDVTPLLADRDAFRAAVRAMAEPFHGDGITHVAAIESRGFLFGAPIALELSAGLIPLRKVGKLPFRTEREDYALEYGSASLEAHVDACEGAAAVLVVDDVLATGGTAAAACRLVERLGGRIAGLTFLLSLDMLGGERALAGRRVERLLRYQWSTAVTA